MSDTTEAAVRRVPRPSPTLDGVCRQLEGLVEPAETALASSFAELFLAKAPPEFLQEQSTDALAHVVLGAFRFLQRSQPGLVDVQVFDPSMELEGWAAPVTVVRSNISDRPFIIDTMREYLHLQDFAIEYMIYPVLYVGRDESGRIREIRAAEPGEPRESLVHCEVARATQPVELEKIQREVALRLQDVVCVTDDFHAMQDATDVVAAELAERADSLPDRHAELTEIQTFLGWLREGAFVFLGYRAYDIVTEDGQVQLVVQTGSGLGVLRNEANSSYAEAVPLENLKPELRALFEDGPPLIINKTNSEATVHRRARMDYIGVKKLDALGKVAGEHRFIGLFTSRAYAEDAETIPILRDKLRQIQDATAVAPDSHDYKEVKTIFNSMPKEELFLTSAEQIGEDVRTVLTAYDTDEVRVALRGDILHRGVSAMVIIPGDRYSTDVRKRVEKMLVATFEGELLNFYLAPGGRDQARLHFYLGARPGLIETIEASEIEVSIGQLIRSWGDRVREGLEGARPADEARRLARRYGEAFSEEYRGTGGADVVVQEILELEAMQAEDRPVSVSFSNTADTSWVPGEEKVTELRLYQMGGRLILSEFMPILENAGLRVIAVDPFEVRGAGVPKAIVYTFAVQDKTGQPLDVADRGQVVADAILAVRSGDVSNDITNGLVLATGLHWREVDVLRSYSAYAFQLRALPTRYGLPAVLLNHPHIARMLFELFQVKFDPDRHANLGERQSAAKDVRAEVIDALTGVTLLAEDRAVRHLLALIEATVRTNYYRNGGRTPSRRSGGVPYTSLKFACDALQAVVKSRQKFEVWVRSSRMEGVHLRGAKVARGGIRWSDRLDDFRTEILGLVNTQMVKNAVIVPSGSKGGFVLLRTPADPQELAVEAEEQYSTLMRGLLDLTDNLDPSGAVVPPEGVVAFDDPDPYLVVAADKGTAKFSDVANGVSAEYGYWLGDAFASGGSQGYDHKAVGITARGAWECVRRHFREKGKDIQSEPFTVVGVGDMSGDVFGNGMLLSRQIKLVAAFDHRHVFVDPNPDPEPSLQERERIFGLGRSSWADYDSSLLSRGGVVVPRGSKEVTLGPEALTALGLPSDTGPMDGEALIRAVLCAPVELFWNGGIGTYVKAPEEIHADVGDPSNHAVRVNADQLRCEVVGEGGNLGFTQLARIHYALKGGRINTDALDNSAGVDMSDHEVNLKILLNPAVRAGLITEERRNDLLEELTTEVAELVLEDNRSQSQAVSLDELRTGESSDEFRGLITSFEKAGLLDRAAEVLPTFEGLAEREEDGGTLTRPELSILLAYGKLWLDAQVIDSDLPDDPVMGAYLGDYFPAAAVAEAGDDLLQSHRLRREIITTQLGNDLVDLMGSTFVMRVVRDTGRPAHEVVRAWAVAAHLAGHRAVLEQLASQPGPVPSEVEYRWQLRLARMLERTARWVLRHVPAETPTAQIIADNVEGIAVLRSRFADLVAGGDRQQYEARVADGKELSGDGALAEDLGALRFLDQLLEILSVGKETEADPVDAGRAFYRVSDLLQVQWIRNAIFEIAEDDRWEQRAALALSDDLSRAHHELVAQVLRTRTLVPNIDRPTDHVMGSRKDDVARFQSLLQEIQGDQAMSLSGLSVAVREIGWLAERMNGSGP